MTQNNNEIQGQTNLLDLLPEDQRPKEVAPAKPTTKAASKPKEEPEPDYYEIDRVVYYAGHKIDVPDREWKLEDVRKWLEEDQFPELTKERCEMVYDKEKGTIIPVLRGHKKGADTITLETQVPADRRPVFRILAKDGRAYEVRNTQVGYFVAPIEGAIEVQTGTKLSVPKVPFDILEAIVEHFTLHPETEHLAYIVWDKDESRYSLYWPQQEKSRITVEAKGFVETESRFVVAHVHSHGKLDAFWSSTDNADEVRTGFYGVIGRCDSAKPRMEFRMSVGGTFVRLHPSALFEGPVDTVVMTSWL